MQFFALNGFPCPNFQNLSDHFLRTINKDFDEVTSLLNVHSVSIMLPIYRIYCVPHRRSHHQYIFL
ncbi:hypothetical protein HanPI659440_Chr11g0412781 [Helianthus annuus]|nr:hypothetical protein HanPI659440_Chr11g0412781 [Helianthus annuus]